MDVTRAGQLLSVLDSLALLAFMPYFMFYQENYELIVVLKILYTLYCARYCIQAILECQSWHGLTFVLYNIGLLPRSCLLKPSAVDKEWFHRGRVMCEVVLGVTAKQLPPEHIVQFIAELICPSSAIIKGEWMSESLSGLMCETVRGVFPHGERKSENGLTLCCFSPPFHLGSTQHSYEWGFSAFVLRWRKIGKVCTRCVSMWRWCGWESATSLLPGYSLLFFERLCLLSNIHKHQWAH